MSTLWKLLNYRSPAPYLFNTYIREYDLSKANINALLYTERITKEKYDELLSLDKFDREKTIGLMIRNDQSIYKSIQQGIIEAKHRLFKENNIQDYEVIAIRNDAVFVYSRELDKIAFPPFEFKVKGFYNMYMVLCDLDIFYMDQVLPDGSLNTTIDIKGISDEKLSLHQDGMINLICEAFYRLQREDVSITLKWITDIYNKYINKQLPKEYYRELNADSDYVINTIYQHISSKDIYDGLLPAVDINRNLLVLRDLLWIISNVYMSQMSIK